MTSIRKLKKQIANQYSGEAIKEIAKMQSKIDEYQRLIGDIMLWLLKPGNFSLKSDIPEGELIWTEINKLQKEINELRKIAP